jgi:hypothetical protein
VQFLVNPAHSARLEELDRGLGLSWLLVAEKALRKAPIISAAPNGISTVLALFGAFSYQDNHLK